ncbi:hypothetical protein N3K63_02060 [Microbacterium sp. W1N]|uniref:hypothetical protein n=1 Tax=Microbacterium festucae TaxID=2977531 RepID=UPI0021BFFD0E|nr:hypothetical protein [Microbacterium festucae]MCT9819065.1 hypothetical protein [Microbacterium festucae]
MTPETFDQHHPASPEAAHSAAPRGLQRRQVILAGAWATPVVLLATATPARAEVISQTYTGPVITIADFVSGSHHDVDETDAPGLAGRFTLAYDASRWSPAASSPPASVDATWVIEITNGQTSYGTVTGSAAGLTGSPRSITWSSDSVPTGSGYAVTLTVTGTASSQQYQPDNAVARSDGLSVTPAPTPGADANVPADYLQVQAYSISNLNAGGNGRGPLQWNGAQIGYWSHSDPAVAHFEVVVQIDGPGTEYDLTLAGSDVSVNAGAAVTAGSTQIGPAEGNMQPGLYTATLTVYGTNGTTNSSSAQITLT